MMLKMYSQDFESWASKSNFDQLINQVRKQLRKSDFIINIEKLMKVRGYNNYNQIDYPNLTVNSLLEIYNFDDTDGYIKFAALYFVIDVIHLRYQYDNPKINIIDSFCKVFNFKDFEIQLVSAGWMLENGYPPDNLRKTLFNRELPAYFRFYFLQQLLFTNDFNISYDFYNFFEFPLNDQYPEEGRSIVQCLTAHGNLKEAHDFISQYCSPDGKDFAKNHKNYIIELYRVSKLIGAESKLNSIEFTPSEVDFILGYIACTESAQMLQVNAFYNMHLNNNL